MPSNYFLFYIERYFSILNTRAIHSKMTYSRIARALPGRPDIKELQFSGANFSRGAIARLGQRLQTQYPNHKFQVLLPYENWKPGQWTSGNESISLFSLLDHYDESQLPDDEGDPDYFNRFIIYVRDTPPNSGGCDGELNDCLYRCLKLIYGTFSKMPRAIEKPEYIKKLLGLNRNDPVPVASIDKIEVLARNLALNITGDVTRISKSRSDRHATLILSEGHYTLATNPGRMHPSYLDTKQKSPFVYQEDGLNNTVMIYNNKKVKTLTSMQFQKAKNSKSYAFVPIEKNRKTGVYETLDEAYQRIHEECDAFLQETKKFGLGIDLSYHNWSCKRTALWLFERLSVGVPANEPLDPIEAEWISASMMGGLIWADNDWQGYARQYDITSLYPSIQQSSSSFPIQKGKFKILKDFADHRGYALYGIFRAKVSNSSILFRQNKRNIYTFIDLQRARKLGLQVELNQDDKPNALVYDRTARVSGTVIFGEYVNFLFKIKNQGGIAGRVAKRVLNTLWGALCQRRRAYKILNGKAEDQFTFPEGHILNSIIPVGENEWKFQFTNPGNPFIGEYPRIAPFLLAHGRKTTSELLEPYKEKVRRIHTDGFILEEHSDSPALITCPENASTTLKALKFERQGTCHVRNANQVIWT
jgi:hypothetical protein